MALAYECYLWLKPRLDSRLLSLITGAITAVGGVLALGLASEAINKATGDDPANFEYAKALISLLMTLPLAAFVIVLVSLPAMFVVAVRSIVKVANTRGRKQERHIWIGFGRLLTVLLSAGAANQLVQLDAPLDPRFPGLAAWSAYALDMHIDPRCAPEPGARVARLNDALVMVGHETPTGYAFSRKDCPMVADKPPAP